MTVLRKVGGGTGEASSAADLHVAPDAADDAGAHRRAAHVIVVDIVVGVAVAVVDIPAQ